MKKLLMLILLVRGVAWGGQAPATPSRAAWYDPPQLFVMTAFIANSTWGTWGPDFIVAGEWTPEKQQAAMTAWRKGLGRSYDAERTIRDFRDAGASGVIFYDKWHDGLVSHDTQLTDFKTERDLLRPTVDALHKYKMKTVIYYSLGFDYNPEPKFKDWVCLDAGGKPIPRVFASDYMSFHSLYRQYVIDQLKEVIDRYGPIDGVWLDIVSQPSPIISARANLPVKYSHDPNTAKDFRSWYGKDIAKASDEELEQFKVETFRRLFFDLRNTLRHEQPDVSFAFNGAGMSDIVQPLTATRFDGLMDWFSMEGHLWPAINRSARAGRFMDRPFEVGMILNSSWYVPMEDRPPPPAMSEEEAVVCAATAWIQGANVYAALTPGHSGQFDHDGDMRLLRAIGNWLRQNRDWLLEAAPYADIAVYMGRPKPDLIQIPTLAELWATRPALGVGQVWPTGSRPGMDLDESLRDAGYFTEYHGGAFAAHELPLSSYRMLLLPENALLDEGAVREIREYVREGGRLLAVGHASLLDADGKAATNFQLAEVFGANLTGQLPGYKQLALSDGSGLSGSMALNPPALAVKPGTGGILGTWAGAGNAPAIIENRFGKGSAIYVSADERVLARSGELLAQLAGRLVGAPPVVIKANRNYALLMNRKGSDLLLYLLNRNTPPPSVAGKYVAAIPGAGYTHGSEDVQVILDTRVLGDLRGGEILPHGEAVRCSRRPGMLELDFAASSAVTTVRLFK